MTYKTICLTYYAVGFVHGLVALALRMVAHPEERPKTYGDIVEQVLGFVFVLNVWPLVFLANVISFLRAFRSPDL